MVRPSHVWRLRSRELQLGPRTLVMGILNVTPDSFSDGGKFLSRDHAVGHTLQMLDDGADIIDIGGESTRPGARVAESGIAADEELARVMPVLEDILRERPGTIISVDTYKAEVARTAVSRGVEMINDVSALRWDPLMAATLADLGCGVILMHTRGRPEEWRTLPPSPDIVSEVKSDLRAWQELRAELPFVGAIRRFARARFSVALRNLAQIVHRTHAGARGKRRPRGGTALWHSGNGCGISSRRRACGAGARCEAGGGGGAGGG